MSRAAVMAVRVEPVVDGDVGLGAAAVPHPLRGILLLACGALTALKPSFQRKDR